VVRGWEWCAVGVMVRGGSHGAGCEWCGDGSGAGWEWCGGSSFSFSARKYAVHVNNI